VYIYMVPDMQLRKRTIRLAYLKARVRTAMARQGYIPAQSQPSRDVFHRVTKGSHASTRVSRWARWNLATITSVHTTNGSTVRTSKEPARQRTRYPRPIPATSRCFSSCDHRVSCLYASPMVGSVEAGND
jgi:hypothetical protein